MEGRNLAKKAAFRGLTDIVACLEQKNLKGYHV
jgi:hypothetical protein